ncbi:uncharacterized protein [Dermacentor albipictus]|uniref:uncharacterized protein isoform X1 n=1 Tax=Dermacentor albipictus TaxID=60249 RepID=UPI0038FCDD60
MQSVLLSESPQEVSQGPRLSRQLLRELPDAVHLTGRWTRPSSPNASHEPVEEPWPLEDTSHGGHYMLYTSFVLSLAAAMSVALLSVPPLLMARAVDCPRGCFTLDRKLKASLNHSVHPCDDFYAFVCSGWDGEVRRYISPLDRYRMTFIQSTIKSILLEKIPRHSTKAKGKAAGFLLRCLSRAGGENIAQLKEFLEELGLPWPSKSPATRPQLLNILVRASLKFGMPMFWVFYVGRHPNRPSENTIYMTLDPRCSEWRQHIRALRKKGKVKDYLRRGAEVVGREGQSYSRMIKQVLDTHIEINELAHLYWGDDTVPSLYNLSDPDLRRAINGHLPDDSQLWPEDTIINLQPDFFANLDGTHLSKEGYQERFKLFLGAYVVWALSPMISKYMTNSMLADMGLEGTEGDYHFFICTEALMMLMPLVQWRQSTDTLGDRTPSWNILRLDIRSLSLWMSSYGVTFEHLVKTVSARLATNAFNMSYTWEMLDNAYSYFPNYTDMLFFDLYRQAAMATASYFKKSLRQPEHSIYHVPGIAAIDLYRLLVGREVIVHQYYSSSPLYEPWHPPAVASAVTGTRTSKQVFVLLWFFIFYNTLFESHSTATVDPSMLKLKEDMKRFFAYLNASDTFPEANERKFRDVYLASIAAHTASFLPEMPDWRLPSSGGENATLPPSGENQNGLFKGMEPEQVFFLLSCFDHCGYSGRERLSKIAICNVALPVCPRFRRAFRCGPQHRLFGNFTWPDPPAHSD